MTHRKFLPIAVAALWFPVLAFASGAFEITNDEIGVATHAAPGALTREQVKQELAEWNRRPLAGDGWRQVQGEQGWQAPLSGAAQAATQPSGVARADHEHWQAIGGEAGWVGPFGV